MPGNESPPLLVVTVLMDASARPAAVTRSHGDALERALTASAGHDTAGLELIELAISPQAFAALRRSLAMPPTTVAVYDIFPLSGQVAPELRRVAGQFLAAEALWAMEEHNMLAGVPPNEKLDLPKGWDKDPHAVRTKLVEAGATALSETAIQTFAAIKAKWDASQAAN